MSLRVQPRALASSIALSLVPFAAGQEDASNPGDGASGAPEARRAELSARSSLWWGDLDGDGLQDAFAVLPDGGGRLLANRGEGRFEDVTGLVGLAEVSGIHMASWADVDGDGRVDLYLPSMEGASRLYLQTQEGALVDETAARGLPLEAGVVDARWRDVDGDGHQDLALTTRTEDLLYRNDGRGCFEVLDLGLPPRALPSARPAVFVEEAEIRRALPPVAPTVAEGATSSAAGALGSRGSALGPTSSTAFVPYCADALRDQANTASCVLASTIPVLGDLYPITTDLFVEAGTGRVNTTTPSARFDVNGGSRFNGQARFESQIVSNVGVGPPFLVSSPDQVANLNADLLDGLHASDFAVLPIDSAGILDEAIADADVSPAAAIQGTKVVPEFGGQDVVTGGRLRVGPPLPGGLNLWSVLVTSTVPASGDITSLALINDSDGDGVTNSIVLSANGGQTPRAEISADRGWFTLGGERALLVGEQQAVVESLNGEALLTGGSARVIGESSASVYATHGPVTLRSEDSVVQVDDDLDVRGAVYSSLSGSRLAANVQAELDLSVAGALTVEGALDVDGSVNAGVLRAESPFDPLEVWGELGSVYGVRGRGASAGVFGEAADAASGGLDGTRGDSAIFGGFAIYGRHWGTTGAARGVVGQTSASNGDAVTAYGDFAGTGAKYFVQPHPTDPAREVRMVCLEGNESGTYFRGTGFTQGGRAEIEVPEVFRLTTAAEGLTVQVTSVGAPARLWVKSRDLEQIVVRSEFDVEFDYFVNGVRRGFEDLGGRLVRENRSFLPTEMGVPFGTQYPEGVRRMLVENGILNADYTPNEATLAALEDQLEEYRARRAVLSLQRASDEAGGRSGVEEEVKED